MTFQKQILQGLPDSLPSKIKLDTLISRAPKRKQILSEEEKILAIRKKILITKLLM